MARQRGPVHLRGKMADTVFTDGKYGARARSMPTLTEQQKKDKADLPQNKRTPILNSLAGAINTAVKYYAPVLKHGRFYSSLLKKFRAETTDHRPLLLQQIKHEDVNFQRPFGKLCPLPVVELKVTKTLYTAIIDIKAPPYNRKDADCYYLEFILLVWNKEDNQCTHTSEKTAWIHIKDTTIKYTTVKFKRTAKDTEYLLACRCVLGEKEKELYWSDTGMQFLGFGSVTKEGIALLEQRRLENEAARKKVNAKPVVAEKKRLVMRAKR